MRKLEFYERDTLAPYFPNPSSAIILSSLYTNIGETWISENDSDQAAIIFVGKTFYLGGHDISEEIADFLMEQILTKELSQGYIIPQDREMIPYLDEYFQELNDKYSIMKSERHLMDLDMSNLNHNCLMNYVKELPTNYQLKPITEELFYTARNGDQYLNNFIELFPNYIEFEKYGFGFFLLDGSEIIAGISSYARYHDGVEVQIAVHSQHRGQHLGRCLGAKFILECESRGLYPWWDCANPTSEHIAIQLGYVLKQVTPIYRFT
jgi:GNAT superfamily N-acetyltransferase